jgi:hypothetical protein
VADWIRLRAAAVTDDSAARALLYETIVEPLPRTRIGWADAAALEGIGDRARAAQRYAALGDRLSSLRLRLAFSPDAGRRAGVRRELLALASERTGSSAAREAIAVLDSVFVPLTPAEELVIAKAAMRSGLIGRAASGYGRVPNLGASEDRLDYATALTRLGRNAEAAVQFRAVRGPHPLAALASYQAARLMADLISRNMGPFVPGYRVEFPLAAGA